MCDFMQIWNEFVHFINAWGPFAGNLTSILGLFAIVWGFNRHLKVRRLAQEVFHWKNLAEDCLKKLSELGHTK